MLAALRLHYERCCGGIEGRENTVAGSDSQQHDLGSSQQASQLGQPAKPGAQGLGSSQGAAAGEAAAARMRVRILGTMQSVVGSKAWVEDGTGVQEVDVTDHMMADSLGGCRHLSSYFCELSMAKRGLGRGKGMGKKEAPHGGGLASTLH